MTRARSAELAVAHRRPLLECLPAAVPGLLVTAIMAAAVLFMFNPQVLRGDLVDGDSYIHIVRLRSVLTDGSWHGGFFARNNAPFGMAMHWTKAYDLILLALAAPLAAFAGWNGALVWVAPAVGPLATIALILAGVWAARPVCCKAEQRLIGIVLALAPMVLVFGKIGDADHHVMVVAAWLLFMGFALRVTLMPGALRHGVMSGLSAAFALWLSVECILGVGLGIALMGLAWVREGAGLTRTSLGFAATYVLAVVTLLAFDPPYGGWLKAEAGRISILYVAFGGLLALLWAALALAPQDPRAWRTRLAVASTGAVLCGICLAVLFPGVLAPEHAVFGGDSELQFWDESDEMQPTFRTLGDGVLFASAPAIGVVVAAILSWRERRIAAGPAWAMFALMLALLLGPGLRHVRFMIYPEVFAALPIAVLPARLDPLVDRVAPLALRLLGCAFAAMIVLMGSIFLARLPGAATPEAKRQTIDCAVRSVAAALNDGGFMGGSDLIIMTQTTQAAEVLYWTGHRVVDAPFHTNVEGIYAITHDLIEFMTSRDDTASREIVARRGISFVMLCPIERTGADPIDPDGRKLYMRLLNGDVPGWLVAQPWPAGVTSDLRLFRVASPGERAD